MGVGVGVKSEAYQDHKLGRQLGATPLGAALSLVHAAGDYRINAALVEANPADARFQGWAGNLYREETAYGRVARALFAPGRRKAPEEMYRSGLRLRSAVGWATSLPWAFRLATNAYVGQKHPEEHFSPQSVAITLDSAAAGTQAVQALTLCTGQQMALHSRWQSSAAVVLRRSWRFGFAGGALQMGAGILRVGIETDHYLKTGDLNNSTIFYGVGDTFAGATDIGWSHFVLKEARAARSAMQAAKKSLNDISAENQALLGAVNPVKRVRTGLKIAGVAGAAIGLGINIYALATACTETEISEESKRKQILSASIGIAGSCLMIAATLMIGTALAPVAGLALAAGTAALIGQTVFDYWA